MIRVPGNGNPNAILMLVGEAPGAHEEEQMLPFVGPSGAMVDEMLRSAGTERSEVYVTNVCKVRPPNNEIHRLKEIGLSIDYFMPELWGEIESVKPNCILALGNTALKALTGYTGIQKYRGSILTNSHSSLPKVVPTIHPASLLHKEKESSSWRDKAFIQFDMNRAVQQSLFKEYRVPQRNLHVANNSLDLIRFLERHSGPVSVDIETFKTIPICIGFAFNKHEAISVPFFNILSAENPDGIPRNDVAYIWKIIAEFLHDAKIIGQNYKFDEKRLDAVGISSRVWFDTMLGFHVLYSELPKRLQFISSVLTEEPYYKDELTEYNPAKDKLNATMMYNAKDAAVTFECYEKINAELIALGLLDFFHEKVMPLHELYGSMEDEGILIDMDVRKELDGKYQGLDEINDKELVELVGHDINVNSPKQVATLLYGELRCPMRKDTGEETLQALMLNAIKDEKRRSILFKILKGRKLKKVRSTYIKAKVHPDGRMRTQCNICGAESGRTTTSKRKAPVEVEPYGLAFQTLSKHGDEDVRFEYGDIGSDLRRMFVPDKGYIFIEPDLSQAEDRVVCLLAQDYAALREYERKEFVWNAHGVKDDRHTKTTMMVLDLAFEAITEDVRQLGKKTRHAGNYKMGKGRLSQMALISQWRAGRCLEKFHSANPNIEHVFWAEIRAALHENNNVLISPHGRRRQFFDRWGEELFKQAYAHLPQATVSDHVKFQLLRIRRRLPFMKVCSESHDSFLGQIPEDKLDEAKVVIKEELETPIDFSKCSLPRRELIIPCEIKIGVKNWQEMRKIV